MKDISKDNNLIFLLISLILLLFSMALIKQTELPFFDIFNKIIIVLVFILGVHSQRLDKSWFWAVYFMALVSALLFLSRLFFENTLFADYFHLITFLFFFIGSFILSFKQIIMSKSVTTNMIVGSVVLYLLLGLIWTIIYLLLMITYPESFSNVPPLPWRENFSQISYFSFVTLTTLGYGDVSPQNSIAQFFVYIEAIVGIFYMAIIVSSLVSARLQSLKLDGEKMEK